MAKYKKNFITEAIIRIDFTSHIKDFANTIPEDLDRLILTYFPYKEVKNSFNEELILNPNSDVVERKRTEFKEWNYYANDKKKRFCITKDFFFISFHQYLSYADFTEGVINILQEIATTQDDFSAKRIGIRYIDNIKIDNGEPTDWKEYINDHMTCIFDIKLQESEITRAFQILELVNTDIKTKFQFGMYNPDFPSVIKQKVFVLDTDSSKVGKMSGEDLITIIPEIHEIIHRLFENSIKDNLRNLLNE